MKNLENKFVGGSVLDVKIEERNGVNVGIVEGYIATWDLDRGDGWVQDQFVKGAFRKSIKDFKKRNRNVRLKDHHGRTIGGFPASTLKEDAKGLFGRGEINLEVAQGNDAYVLAKQGVLVEFSIGFSVVKSTRDEQDNVRTITEALIWEGSIVDEPMNPEAQITAVKTREGKKMTEVTEEEVKSMTKRDLEDALRDGRSFTKQASITVASLFDGKEPEETESQKTVRLEKEAEEKRLADEKAEQEEDEIAYKQIEEALEGFGNSLKQTA